MALYRHFRYLFRRLLPCQNVDASDRHLRQWLFTDTTNVKGLITPAKLEESI